MPPSKGKSRSKTATSGNGGKICSSKPKKKEPDNDEKAPKLKTSSTSTLKILLDLENEHKDLAEETNKVQKEHKELLLRKDSEATVLDQELVEKEALLKECRSLQLENEEPTDFAVDEVGGIFQDHDEKTDVNKLAKISNELIKNLVNLEKRKWEIGEHVINEIKRHNVYAELRKILNREHHGTYKSFGRVFLKAKIKEFGRWIEEKQKELDQLKDARNVSTGDCWERAAEKYGAEMKEWMEEKGRLENEFLDKEERLKSIKECETFVENDIVNKKAKIERQSEVNRKQIFNSIEFKELMEHRDGLIVRIEKSLSIIEDTKEACRNAVLKSNELHLNMLKTQKRVQELTSKAFELSKENEQERMRMMEASAKMDYVSHELNGKNGVLLRLEVDIEELESNKEMLEENLNHCLLQIEKYEEKNDAMETRINQLNDQYYLGAHSKSP